MSIELKIVISSLEGQFFSSSAICSPEDRFNPSLDIAMAFDSVWEAFETVLDVFGWDIMSTPFYVIPKIVQIDSELIRDRLFSSDRCLDSAEYLGSEFFYYDYEEGNTILEYEDGELLERAFIPRAECNLMEQEKPISKLKQDPEWVRGFIKKYLDEDI